MQNQSKREITFDTQLKTALNLNYSNMNLCNKLLKILDYERKVGR